MLPPPQLVASGGTSLCFVPISITSNAHRHREVEIFAGIMKCSIPKGVLERIPREHKTPQLPERHPQTSKERNREEGPGGGPCKTQGTPKPRSPTPGTPTFQQRHRSPPSQGMPVDTAGKGHPKPEFRNPPALHLGASWQGVEQAGSTSGPIPDQRNV